jgi:gamma-glutamyltranspeptidase/glutathione hydrolase
VGVTAPYNSGLGGGGFATIRKPDGSYEVVDFREKAPMAVSADMFAGRSNMSIWGGLAR